jgi:undecaprenyl phosphate-alpha-L-ara4N flippase subunit ArnF
MKPSARTLGLAAIAGSVLLSAIGQLGMKAGMVALKGVLDATGQPPPLAALREPLTWTVSGLVAYACSLALWLVVLARYPLSVAYPLLSLSYVCVYLGATVWPRLAEPATPLRTVGTLLILLGVAFVSFSRSRAPDPANAAQNRAS